MTSNATPEGRLGELHVKVARVMHQALDVVDVAQSRYLEDEEAIDPPAPISAPLLSVITKFLSDNSITAAPEESAGMSDLAQRLKSKRRSVGNVAHIEDY